ncbi:MAG TPA: hypothetical protein VGP14_12035 [Casimicrobiaceae bacterium]|nr:hypothetical protein [Casimicrobiaceae bacterium]
MNPDDPTSDPLPPSDWRPMSHWLHKPASRQDVVTIRKVWVTLAASVVLHIAALFLVLTHPPIPGPDQQAADQESSPIQVDLAEATRALPPPSAPAEPAAAPRSRTPPRAARVRPPPMVAMPRLETPAIRTPALAPPPQIAAAPAPPQARPPAQGDFLSFVQANRRARGAAESPAPDNPDVDFNTRIAANLPGAAHGVAAKQSIRGGGIFQIKRMSYDDAAFEFFGWNTEMGRQTPQMIEVRKGNNPDMHIAVVRRMIVIIREHEHEDFTWESGRHGRVVTLSARPADTAALEAFLLRDLFDDTHAGP